MRCSIDKATPGANFDSTFSTNGGIAYRVDIDLSGDTYIAQMDSNEIWVYMKTDSGNFPSGSGSQTLTIGNSVSPGDLSPDGTYIAVEEATLKKVQIYKQASLSFSLDHTIDIEPDHSTVADV